jgi:hypothetical protein
MKQNLSASSVTDSYVACGTSLGVAFVYLFLTFVGIMVYMPFYTRFADNSLANFLGIVVAAVAVGMVHQSTRFIALLLLSLTVGLQKGSTK